MVFGIFKGCGSRKAVFTMPEKTDTMNSDPTDDSVSSSYYCHDKYSALESLAMQSQWEALIRLVENSQLDEWKSDNGVAATRQTTPLHVALAHRAPIHVVDALLAIVSKTTHHLGKTYSPEEAKDVQGRTPLHVAVTVGCEEAVVHRLLAGENLVMPAVARDAQHQTPLHAACRAPLAKHKKKKRMAIDLYNKQRVIRVLLDQYPEGAMLLDKHGKTPVDYAVQNNLSTHIIHELKRAADIHTPSMMDHSEISDADLMSVASSDVPLVVKSCRSGGSVCGPRSPLIENTMHIHQNNNIGVLYPAGGSVSDNSDDVSSLGDTEPDLEHKMIQLEEEMNEF
eukprot:scaffold1519_cov166-Amphora_coffeaeformis.AAC.14